MRLLSLSELVLQMTDVCLEGPRGSDVFAVVFQLTCCSYVNASVPSLSEQFARFFFSGCEFLFSQRACIVTLVKFGGYSVALDMLGLK